VQSVVATALAVGGLTGPAAAHGFGQRYDLPIPLSLWVAGAAAAVALSFVIIGLFARSGAARSDYPRVNLLRWRAGRMLADRRTRLIARVVAAALLLLVVAAGTFGNQNPTRNLAPVFVWIVWWVGFAYISAMVGDLWAVVNPWSAIFSWADRLSRRLGAGPLSLGVRYRAWLGVWPATVLFGAFAWAELVYAGRSLPAKLALMILVYSLIAWAGMLTFGRHAWIRYGDPFAVTFGLLARFAPTEVRVTSSAGCRGCEEECDTTATDCVGCGACFARAVPASRQLNLRPYGVGLLRTGDVSRSLVVFVLMLLSTVTYDGFTATPAWSTIESSLYPKLAWLGDLRSATVGTLGLLAFPLAFLAVYQLFAHAMAGAAGGRLSPATVACRFVLSLIPIAIAYHLAHYFTYLLIQGQLAIRLASDPFGVGWNLLGTARYRPDVGIVGARFAWYTAVIAVVAGHIIAVWLAHVVALREFPDRREAIRSQVPMLVLMVGYTIASLWILAQPIVETSPGG
jgi:hypothetical protein